MMPANPKKEGISNLFSDNPYMNGDRQKKSRRKVIHMLKIKWANFLSSPNKSNRMRRIGTRKGSDQPITDSCAPTAVAISEVISATANSDTTNIQIKALMKIINEYEYGSLDNPTGATPLHLACSRGYNPNALSWIISRYPKQVVALDNQLRTPLHEITLCLCEDRISFHDCVTIIDMLCNVSPITIYSSDYKKNTPVDIAQLHVIKASKDNRKEGSLKKLTLLARHLRNIGIQVYRENKRHYERVGVQSAQKSGRINSDCDNFSMIPLSGSTRLSVETESSQTIAILDTSTSDAS